MQIYHLTTSLLIYKLTNSNLWWKDPSILLQSEEYQPSQEQRKFSDEIKDEMVKNPLYITLVMLNNVK